MLTNIKALLVVLVLALLVFHWARPICLRFMALEDFERRRKVWLLLTCFAFLSPTIWIFLLFAGPLLVWAQKRDSNRAALFVMCLSAAPPVTLAIPTIGIGALFDMNLPRALALTVLLPYVVANWGQRSPTRTPLVAAIDYLIGGFLFIQLVVLLPYDSVTNILRRGLHFSLDFVLIYYVFSRSLLKQSSLYEVVAVFCLTCAVAAPLSVFEGARSWLLYQGIGEAWGRPDPFAWLFRGSVLRAQAAAGHSLTFGYYMAMGFGLSMMALRRFDSRKLTIVVGLWMWAGLIAAYSRAPWLTAILFSIVAAVLLPGAVSNLKRLIFGGGVVGALLIMSPFGDAIIDSLPFIGSIDSENVTYRQQLATMSWNLIQKNPFFGDPLVLRDMEQLRQGQGIIDIVNSYASVALFNGLVGLTLFVTPLLLSAYGAFKVLRKTRHIDDNDAALGAGLIAAMASTLFFIATAGYSWLLFGLAGLLTAYMRIDRTEIAVLTPIARERQGAAGSTIAYRPRATRWSR